MSIVDEIDSLRSGISINSSEIDVSDLDTISCSGSHLSGETIDDFDSVDDDDLIIYMDCYCNRCHRVRQLDI